MAVILNDRSKQITIDIEWTLRNGVGPYAYFQVSVESDSGWPLFIKAGYNAGSRKVEFALIWQGHDRIYGLCIGSGHTNRDRSRVGSPHKHRCTERDSQFAYSPPDITSDDPIVAWKQFCDEAKITHAGRLAGPPTIQVDFL